MEETITCSNMRIQQKKKKCRSCERETIIFSHGNCKNCAHKGYKPLKKKREPTGELPLFREIFAHRGGKCEITGEKLNFDVKCFAHILSKGAYPAFRLNPDNIILVKARIHTLFDNEGRESLLREYPGAEEIYRRKEILKPQYHERRNSGGFASD